MSNRPRISRRTKIGLGASALVLVASLGFSSVAGSSDRSAAQQFQPQKLSKLKIQKLLKQEGAKLKIRKLLKQEAAKVRAAFCKRAHRRQFRCRDGKPTKWNVRSRKLLRTYWNTSDPNCPVWTVARPWTGYATVATSAAAICVREAYGTLWNGYPVTVRRGPLVAGLNLRARSRHNYWLGYSAWRTIGEWTTARSLGGCFVRGVSIQAYGVFFRAALLCHASLFVAAPVFPPAGQYHGILTVLAPHTGGALVNRAHSEPLCYWASWIC